MAKLVLTNALVTFASTDLSSNIASITLNTSFDIIETTAFGDTAKKRVAGLADNSVSFEFHQDFATGSVEATIFPLLGTAVACEVRPVNTAVSPTNPKYNFSVLISEWQSLSAEVGSLTTASVTWPISGEITKSTTP
jgi:hypothetical protein